MRPTATPLWLLSAVACGFALHFAADLLIPILFAALLALLLAPVSGRLRRLHLPAPLAAAVSVLGLATGLVLAADTLAGPAADWLGKAPQTLGQLERKLRPVREPVEEVRKATEQVQKLAGSDDDKTRTVKVRRFDLGEVFVVSATKLVAQTVVVVFLVYFTLASGDRMVRVIVSAPNTTGGRRRVVAVARAVKRDVAAYLGTVTLINGGLGLLTGLTMWAWGMPNPALWGAMVALFNFVPYAGATVSFCVISLVGIMSFDSAGRGLLPAITFLAIATVEGNLITPTIIGTRLTLPPGLVFLWLVAWGWLWGIAGAILAVPLLVVLKVAAIHVAPLRPLVPFLGGAGKG
jgi:predicted PurR-regulated permease PerM